jgi:hypothetical protein
MNIRSRGFLAGLLMLTLVALMAISATAFAQRHARRRAVRREERQDYSQLEQTAKTNGYNNGKAEGINDRKRGEPANFRDERAYKNATQGYSPILGSKSHYQEVYRVSFENVIVTAGTDTKPAMRRGREVLIYPQELSNSHASFAFFAPESWISSLLSWKT